MHDKVVVTYGETNSERCQVVDAGGLWDGFNICK